MGAKAPVLTELFAQIPPGTVVELGLSGADSEEGPFGDWVELKTDVPVQASEILNSRYVRYRLTLYGRIFDAPVVDYFSFELQ